MPAKQRRYQQSSALVGEGDVQAGMAGLHMVSLLFFYDRVSSHAATCHSQQTTPSALESHLHWPLIDYLSVWITAVR